MLIQLEQAKLSLRDLEAGINDLKASIKFDTLQQEVADLEMKTGEAGFWDDPQESQKILKVLKVKKSLLENYLHLIRVFDDVSVLIDMTIEEDDESMVDDVLADLEAVRKEYEE
ncbi:MAG: peptide chain release factor 2, partial [Clostridia bacterium]|nr:peptide chain release factor 2 [Clostridia bacterium]